jgi:hypothetical protein
MFKMFKVGFCTEEGNGLSPTQLCPEGRALKVSLSGEI